MKLLDPFAGYRLASGHTFFHIALFGCSFTVRDDDDHKSDDAIISAFNLLRYGHLVLIVLAMIESWASTSSDVPEDLDRADDEKSVEKQSGVVEL